VSLIPVRAHQRDSSQVHRLTELTSELLRSLARQPDMSCLTELDAAAHLFTYLLRDGLHFVVLGHITDVREDIV